MNMLFTCERVHATCLNLAQFTCENIEFKREFSFV